MSIAINAWVRGNLAAGFLGSILFMTHESQLQGLCGVLLFSGLLVLHIKKPEGHQRVSVWAVYAMVPCIIWQLVFTPTPWGLFTGVVVIFNATLLGNAVMTKHEELLLVMATLLLLASTIALLKVHQKAWMLNETSTRAPRAQLHFSPSQPESWTALRVLESTGAFASEHAPAIIPIANEPKDVRYFVQLQEIMENQQVFSVDLLPKPSAENMDDGIMQRCSLRYLQMYVRLLWNKSIAIRDGDGSIPVFVQMTSGPVMPSIPLSDESRKVQLKQ